MARGQALLDAMDELGYVAWDENHRNGQLDQVNLRRTPATPTAPTAPTASCSHCQLADMPAMRGVQTCSPISPYVRRTPTAPTAHHPPRPPPPRCRAEERRAGGQVPWLIKRDRNHPSVVIWSICNEVLCNSKVGCGLLALSL